MTDYRYVDPSEFEKLKAAAKSLQDYLNQKYDPHTIIVVQNDRVDVYRSEIGTPTINLPGLTF